MEDFLIEFYPWIKSLHLISVIGWMAGMMYLPRLYIYHSQAEKGSVQSETFKIMERRLLRGIINPAMIATFIFGTCLMFTPGIIDWSAGWIWVKLAMIVGLSAIHGIYSKWRREFAEDRNEMSDRSFRLINEAPFVLMMVIVVMVIVKPF